MAELVLVPCGRGISSVSFVARNRQFVAYVSSHRGRMSPETSFFPEAEFEDQCRRSIDRDNLVMKSNHLPPRLHHDVSHMRPARSTAKLG